MDFTRANGVGIASLSLRKTSLEQRESICCSSPANRMLLAFGLGMLLFLGMSLVPMFMFETSSDRFNQLRQLIAMVSGYSMVFTATLGLFVVSSHLRDRNVKLVLTKPCLPEIWLASIFLSAILIAILIYTPIAPGAVGLSWFWGIPWQPFGPQLARMGDSVGAMPVISIFFGIVIRMYYEDHDPAHFHAEYQGQRAKFDLDGKLIAGNIRSATARRRIADWAKLHQEALEANWRSMRARRPLDRIEPLN